MDENGDPVLVDNRLTPVFSTFESLIENWIPSRGARVDLNTTSFFINDNWSLNDHLSFNLGVRGELVSSEATPGDITTVDTRAIVPRLAASYDPLGDGRYSIQATYSHYSGKYSEAQFAENTNVGNPSLLYGYYVGPTHECPGLPNAAAADCPGLDPDNYVTFLGRFPTQNVFTDERLNSPVTKEFTLSSGTTLGRRGYFQATYVRRRSASFVEDYQDLTTGTTVLTDPDTGDEYGEFTNKVYRNPGDLGDDPAGDSRRARLHRRSLVAHAVLLGRPRVGALRRIRPVRPVAPLRHPGLAAPAAVAEDRVVQPDQQRQAALFQYDGAARHGRAAGRVGDPDRLHGGRPLRRSDLGQRLPCRPVVPHCLGLPLLALANRRRPAEPRKRRQLIARPVQTMTATPRDTTPAIDCPITPYTSPVCANRNQRRILKPRLKVG